MTGIGVWVKVAGKGEGKVKGKFILCSKWGRWVNFEFKFSTCEVFSKYGQIFLKLSLMMGIKNWVQTAVWIFKDN